MTPTNAAKFQSKKLGVFSFLPPFSAASSSILSVSSSRCRFNSGFRNRDPFVVRAEGEADADAEPETTSVATEVADDVEDETVKVEEEEVEAKPLRKPIVKLGDIMGVSSLNSSFVSVKLRVCNFIPLCTKMMDFFY